MSGGVTGASSKMMIFHWFLQHFESAPLGGGPGYIVGFVVCVVAMGRPRPVVGGGAATDKTFPLQGG